MSPSSTDAESVNNIEQTETWPKYDSELEVVENDPTKLAEPIEKSDPGMKNPRTDKQLPRVFSE